MIKRIKTGIPGLDSLMEGGFILNSVYLVTGETGTGKTIFGSQFLWHGLQKGESGVFISMEEDPREIKDDVSRFGWDFDKYEKKGLLRIIYHDPAQVDKLGTLIRSEIMGLKANRLVLDSTAAMGLAL
jgi:KaiC/GvpD/RAD55 family RecA-like ATPase